jgi:hypothetical protein
VNDMSESVIIVDDQHYETTTGVHVWRYRKTSMNAGTACMMVYAFQSG